MTGILLEKLLTFCKALLEILVGPTTLTSRGWSARCTGHVCLAQYVRMVRSCGLRYLGVTLRQLEHGVFRSHLILRC
jgi:hypothetical protein